MTRTGARRWFFVGVSLMMTSVVWGVERPQLPGLFARISASPVKESSGLVPSRRHDGIFWTHNDSGDGPALYAIRLDGSLVSTVAVEGAKARDWEDIAMDAEGHLYIGDVGNNRLRRNDMALYKVDEPATLAPDQSVRVLESIPVAYPDGSYNCEALFVDRDGRPNLITKDPGAPRVYRLEDGNWTFQQKLEAHDVATGADLAPDGRLAVSTYLGYILYQRDEDGKWGQVDRMFAVLEQCEAVCWYRNALLFTSEQRGFFRFVPDGGVSPRSVFQRFHWNPADPKKTYVPRRDGQAQSETLRFSFAPGDGRTRIRLHARWREHSGRAVFLFSSGSLVDRIHTGPADHEVEVVCRKGALRLHARRLAPPGQPKAKADLPVELKKVDDTTLELSFSDDWIRVQRGFAAYFFGFGSPTAGWPYSYYRIHGHPLLWAEKGP